MEVENSTGRIIAHTLQLKRESINDKAKVRNVDKADTDDENINGNNCFNMMNKGNNSAAMSAAVSNKIMKSLDGAYLVRLSAEDVVRIAKRHPLPSMLILSLLFFMGVEYTLQMVPSSSPPLDVGFILTEYIHGAISGRPTLNSALAAANTVFVAMQMAYIFWTLLVEGRPRSTIAALFMFTSRGILGYSTQLPLPQGFLGSGVDFPVGNMSFYLFFSGHVGGSIIASLDMRRMGRYRLAWMFDALNVLQSLRLLATRGHYTIDLAAGLGAGFLFDALAGKYEEIKKKGRGNGGACCCSCKKS